MSHLVVLVAAAVSSSAHGGPPTGPDGAPPSSAVEEIAARLERLRALPEVATAPDAFRGPLAQVTGALEAATARRAANDRAGAARALEIARAWVVVVERRLALDRERVALAAARRARDRERAREAELLRQLEGAQAPVESRAPPPSPPTAHGR